MMHLSVTSPLLITAHKERGGRCNCKDHSRRTEWHASLFALPLSRGIVSS